MLLLRVCQRSYFSKSAGVDSIHVFRTTRLLSGFEAVKMPTNANSCGAEIVLFPEFSVELISLRLLYVELALLDAVLVTRALLLDLNSSKTAAHATASSSTSANGRVGNFCRRS